MIGQTALPAPFVDAAWWDAHAWPIAITLVIAIGFTFASRRWIARFRKRAKAAGEEGEGRRLRRVATVVGLVSGLAVVIGWFVFVLVLLDAVDVKTAPLLASAGIAGVALGFGAQTLVRDTISGLFIFLEGQYDVGDIVDLTTGPGTVSGVVESLNIRTTGDPAVRRVALDRPQRCDRDHEQPHARVGHERSWTCASRSPRTPSACASCWRNCSTSWRRFRPLRDWLRQRPQVQGVTQLTDVAQVIRVIAETAPAHRMEAERLLRERIVARIGERGIKSPPVAATQRSHEPGR